VIKELKKEVDCTDVIEYYTVDDKTYFMILNTDLKQGENKFVIDYKIEAIVGYVWVLLIVGIILIAIAFVYIRARYKNNSTPDFMWVDKIVKCFIWIKKPYRELLLKKNRYKTKGKK